MAVQQKPSRERGLWKLSLAWVVPPGQSPAAVGLQGKFAWCLFMCFMKGLQAPSCLCPPVRELLKLYLQWKVTGGEEKQLSNHVDVGLLSVKKDLDVSGAQRCWLSQVSSWEHLCEDGVFPKEATV